MPPRSDRNLTPISAGVVSAKNGPGVAVPKIVKVEPAGVFVKLKAAGVEFPATEAVILYEPTMLLAVVTGAVAMPEASVLTVTELWPLNVALAPLAGAVKVTVTPETGFDAASVTLAWSALANAVPAFVLWGVPEIATIESVDTGTDGTKTTS